MIDKTLLSQVRDIFAGLSHKYTFRVISRSSLPFSKEMLDFFTQVASVSDNIGVETEEANTDKARVELFRDGYPLGIFFRCIPGGHEFSSLLLAVLNADGKGKTLPDSSLAARIKALKGPLSVTCYVSLECTNCPDVVQSLNQMALFNDNIVVETVDGNVAVGEVEALGVKSVPTVFVNGEQAWVGNASLGDLLEMLESRYGSNPVETAPETRDFDMIVVGGGPAGASAAVYSARKGLKVAVVAGRVGGQVKETSGIENVISVLHTTGEKLANDLRLHMDDYGISIFDSRTVESVDLKEKIKTVHVKGGEVFHAPQVVIATGASWRRLGIPGESEYVGKGIGFCVHCDGPFFKGKDVAVIGGGNSGIEAAIDLAAICRHVDVFEFLDSLKADRVLVEKARSLPNVDIHLGSQVASIIGDGHKVTGLDVRDRKTGSTRHYDLSGVFIQIGLSPNSTPFVPQVPANKGGEIIVDAFCRTEIPGVYAAGDVTDVPYKQIVVAMGEGAKAALSATDDRMRQETV